MINLFKPLISKKFNFIYYPNGDFLVLYYKDQKNKVHIGDYIYYDEKNGFKIKKGN